MSARRIPYGRQTIDPTDIEAVVEVLRSDWLTQGPLIARFEEAVAAYCGVRYGVAVSSGTAALHLACLAAGLGPGDRLWTSPNTFAASANCALYCGAIPEFVDIDPQSYNLSVECLETRLAAAAREHRLPKVVIPVHFAGASAEMAEISRQCRRHGITLVEDASHALGGSYQDAKVGSCRHSDMAVFSFHPVKSITTGEGGMVVTDSQELYQRLLRFRTHGITRDPQFLEHPSIGDWYYEQVDLGFNYRVTDIQAALGLSQLKRLDSFVERRAGLARRYSEELAGLPLVLPTVRPESRSAYHLYVIRLRLDLIKQTRREVFDGLRRLGIGVNVHYIPVHTHPYYRRLGFAHGDFPRAESYYAGALSLPLFPTLSSSDQDHVIASLREVLA